MTDVRAQGLDATSLSVYPTRRADAPALVRDASIRIIRGELVALLGPNGAGKTSLLRGLLGLAPRADGDVHLDGQPIRTLSTLERARRVAYLPQLRPAAWPSPVRDVVALGRFAYGGPLGRLGPADSAAVARAMSACSVDHLGERSARALSGGEAARVHVARAFAAETPLLLADEPTTALDPLRQFQIMDLLRGYVDRGAGALVVVHDVALAARYADRLVWMLDGRIVADGRPETTLTAERLAHIYGVDARVDGRRVAMLGPIAAPPRNL